jgi:hypothetical protein
MDTDTTRVRGTLYHLVAGPRSGDRLLPLATQRREQPELYARHRVRYAGHEDVLDQPIAPLGCTWAEVVFLSPVHPAPIVEALAYTGRRVRTGDLLALDAGRLDPARTTIRLMRAGAGGHRADPPDRDDYLPWTTASLRAVDRVTLAAVRRLESLQPGDPWLPWVDVPHVLHRGAIPLAWFRPASAGG